jgi:Family of unknown function (DUF6204)
VSLHIHRVFVRGRFGALGHDTRDRLVAHAADHDVTRAAFTESGTLTYEPSLRSFTFRFRLRAEGDDHEAIVTARARELASAWLAELGVGERELRVQAGDMADVWERRDDPAPHRAAGPVGGAS